MLTENGEVNNKCKLIPKPVWKVSLSKQKMFYLYYR